MLKRRLSDGEKQEKKRSKYEQTGNEVQELSAGATVALLRIARKQLDETRKLWQQRNNIEAKNKGAEVLSSATHILVLAPHNLYARQIRAEAFFLIGALDEAINEANTILVNNPATMHKIALASVYLTLARAKAAKNLPNIAELLQIHYLKEQFFSTRLPLDARYHFHMRTGIEHEARREYYQASHRFNNALHFKAASLFRDNQFPEAIKATQEAIEKLHPNFVHRYKLARAPNPRGDSYVLSIAEESETFVKIQLQLTAKDPLGGPEVNEQSLYLVFPKLSENRTPANITPVEVILELGNQLSAEHRELNRLAMLSLLEGIRSYRRNMHLHKISSIITDAENSEYNSESEMDGLAEETEPTQVEQDSTEEDRQRERAEITQVESHAQESLENMLFAFIRNSNNHFNVVNAILWLGSNAQVIELIQFIDQYIRSFEQQRDFLVPSILQKIYRHNLLSRLAIIPECRDILIKCLVEGTLHIAPLFIPILMTFKQNNSFVLPYIVDNINQEQSLQLAKWVLSPLVRRELGTELFCRCLTEVHAEFNCTLPVLFMRKSLQVNPRRGHEHLRNLPAQQTVDNDLTNLLLTWMEEQESLHFFQRYPGLFFKLLISGPVTANNTRLSLPFIMASNANEANVIKFLEFLNHPLIKGILKRNPELTVQFLSTLYQVNDNSTFENLPPGTMPLLFLSTVVQRFPQLHPAITGWFAEVLPQYSSFEVIRTSNTAPPQAGQRPTHR